MCEFNVNNKRKAKDTTNKWKYSYGSCKRIQETREQNQHRYKKKLKHLITNRKINRSLRSLNLTTKSVI